MLVNSKHRFGMGLVKFSGSRVDVYGLCSDYFVSCRLHILCISKLSNEHVFEGTHRGSWENGIKGKFVFIRKV